MRLWQGQYGPFIRFAQMQFCRRLFVVPMSTFRRLAEEIGDPSGELIFLFNTGRCGSTLLAQVNQSINQFSYPSLFLTVVGLLLQSQNGFGRQTVE